MGIFFTQFANNTVSYVKSCFQHFITSFTKDTALKETLPTIRPTYMIVNI